MFSWQFLPSLSWLDAWRWTFIFRIKKITRLVWVARIDQPQNSNNSRLVTLREVFKKNDKCHTCLRPPSSVWRTKINSAHWDSSLHSGKFSIAHWEFFPLHIGIFSSQSKLRFFVVSLKVVNITILSKISVDMYLKSQTNQNKVAVLFKHFDQPKVLFFMFLAHFWTL